MRIRECRRQGALRSWQCGKLKIVRKREETMRKEAQVFVLGPESKEF